MHIRGKFRHGPTRVLMCGNLMLSSMHVNQIWVGVAISKIMVEDERRKITKVSYTKDS